MFEKCKNTIQKSEFLNKIVIYLKWHERQVKCGDANPEKIFYVIRRHDRNAGLFSFVMTNLGAIDHAVEQGYIPVIDMMNYPNSLLTKDQIQKHNAWEDFFEQPCGYDMDQVMHSKKVILGSINPTEHFPDYSMLNDSREMNKWKKCAGNYLRLLSKYQSAAVEYYNNCFGNERVLGVLCRGTDYLKLKPHDHPIQPDVDQMIIKCRDSMMKWNCRYIYLATEDKYIWDSFLEKFGSNLFSYQKKHYEMATAKYLTQEIKADDEAIIRNTEYLISIAILAKCNCLVAGATSGTYGALLLTKGYEQQYIYTLGRYE